GVGHGAAAGPEVGLVEDEHRGAVLLGEVRQADAADGDDAVGLTARGGRPDVTGQGIEIRHYILSGAVTPSRPSALASVRRVASARPRRAECSGCGSSPAFGRMWQAS